MTSTILLLFCILIYFTSEFRKREKDAQAHSERLFLYQQAERERNQLLNRTMAKDLQDYRTSVTTEASVEADHETKMVHRSLDQQFGPEWRADA